MGIFNKPSVLVLFHILFISILPLNITSSPRTEAEALVKWKNTLLESSSLDSWSLNNIKNLCNWFGITCNTAGTVLKLDISFEILTGTLARFNFSSFPNLVYLDMSINNLSGRIPVDIGNATQLQRLSLSYNYFNGNIPYQISHFLKLQYLDLGHHLHYNLQVINLFDDSFVGSIPSSIGQLTELQTLDLRKNNLNSSIPPELGLCSELNYLDLSENSLTGLLPYSFSNLTRNFQLYLSDNHLSGELSSHFISNWTELILLDIQNNTFRGNIPSETIGM